MAGRFTKKEPEFIYFLEARDGAFYGPYVNPKKGFESSTRKYKLTEVPMPLPKAKTK